MKVVCVRLVYAAFTP
ncbi:hypothetical protein M2G54_19775 [Vibrio vulnificus]|nr:hypothetical protein [Vibrio vulnificus]